MSAEPRSVHDGGAFFECPRWHDGHWWVSDFYQQRVVVLDGDGALVETIALDVMPSGLGWLPDGSMLIVAMEERQLLRRAADGALTVHSDLSASCHGPLNDMVVSADGRAYVGGIGFHRASELPRPASLFVVDPDGSARVAADELWMPNGAVITADGTKLIVSETLAGRHTAFDIAADGSLSGRRAWAQVGPAERPGALPDMLAAIEYAPDGCGLDDDGRVWAADPPRSRCCCVAEGGAIEAVVPLADGDGAFACMLGGPDGRSLLICVAPNGVKRPGSTAARLYLTTVDAAHAGRP